MKKLILSLFITIFSCSDSPNQSPESLAKYYIQYAKEGDFLNIVNKINYGDADKKLSSSEYFEKLGEEKLPNGFSKQTALIFYYRDKYKNSYVTEINKISSDIAVIKIISESFVEKKGMYIEDHTFAGNFDGKWYIIGTKETIDGNDLNAIGRSKAGVISKYILENK